MVRSDGLKMHFVRDISSSVTWGKAQTPVLMRQNNCRKIRKTGRNYEMILAVGDGSVIDMAKAIAIALKNDTPFWDYFEKRRK